MKIRFADEGDLERVVEIYNQSVPGGWSTADTSPVTVESRLAWFRSFDRERRPIWVAEVDERIVGWASLSWFYGGRAAYDATAEISVYVAADSRRRGFGKALKGWVIDQCPGLGITTVLSLYFDHNEATRRINQGLGFQVCGHIEGIAEVQGRTRGLVIAALRIAADRSTLIGRADPGPSG